jgi:hypothetical protein
MYSKKNSKNSRNSGALDFTTNNTNEDPNDYPRTLGF